MDLSEQLAVPYVAVVYSVERPDGNWWRRAEYPELPGCAAEAPAAADAMELLERERVRIIVEAHARGADLPAPRAPLAAGVSGLSGRPLYEIVREVGEAAERAAISG
jgi:predicted RNase H-like HicB family nuclease